MKKEELDFVLESNKYLKGGTKEACIKAREIVANYINPGNQLHPLLTTTTVEEFVEAVKVLMAFAFSQPDTIPERWDCDNDCKRVGDLLCPGECNLSKTETRICPFFIDEGNI